MHEPLSPTTHFTDSTYCTFRHITKTHREKLLWLLLMSIHFPPPPTQAVGRESHLKNSPPRFPIFFKRSQPHPTQPTGFAVQHELQRQLHLRTLPSRDFSIIEKEKTSIHAISQHWLSNSFSDSSNCLAWNFLLTHQATHQATHRV